MAALAATDAPSHTANYFAAADAPRISQANANRRHAGMQRDAGGVSDTVSQALFEQPLTQLTSLTGNASSKRR
jgi:hypothetical protein